MPKLFGNSFDLSEVVVARPLHCIRQLHILLVKLWQEHCCLGGTCEETLLIQGHIESGRQTVSLAWKGNEDLHAVEMEKTGILSRQVQVS